MSEVPYLTESDLRARLDRLPRVPLAHLPTPLDACTRLEEELGGPSIHVKRDDATGLALGGNKTRQLEYILGFALANGYDCVVQGSASQSNHSRQLAAAGAKLGLEVHLTPLQDARSSPVQGNYLLSHLYGAKLHPVPLGASVIEAKERVAEELRRQGRNPLIIGMGAHEPLVLAAVAYVGAFLEIIDQLGAAGPPDYLYTASQGSTQAGLLAAARMLGLDTRVVGINPMGPSHEAYSPPETIHRMALEAGGHLGFPLEIPITDVDNRTGFVGEGYGKVSAGGARALRLLAEREGILLDPVYSGKGFAGLLSAIEEHELNSGDSVVFVHTGGLPALFSYAQEVLSAEPLST